MGLENQHRLILLLDNPGQIRKLMQAKEQRLCLLVNAGIIHLMLIFKPH